MKRLKRLDKAVCYSNDSTPKSIYYERPDFEERFTGSMSGEDSKTYKIDVESDMNRKPILFDSTNKPLIQDKRIGFKRDS